jgi:hypothetical protein
VGADRADVFADDLRMADYGEWREFIEKLGEYIARGTPDSFVANGRIYRFPENKGVYASALNGIFSIAGGDPGFYGHDLLALMLRAADADVWASAKKDAVEKAAEAEADKEENDVENDESDAENGEEISAISTTAAAFDAIRPGLNSYVEALDCITARLAGKYAPGIRSKGFIDTKIYGKSDAAEIFADGRAVFVAANSADFDAFSESNAEQAKNLILLPVKLPYAENGLPDQWEDRSINRLIPARVTHFFVVNGRVAPELQKPALDFIRWLIEEERSMEDSLKGSVRGYFDRGDVLPYPTDDSFTRSYSDALRKKGLAEYLTDDRWDAEYRESLLDFMFTVWYED